MSPKLLNVRLFVLLIGCSILLLSGRAEASIIGGSVTGGSAFTAGGTFVQLTPPLNNPFGPPNSVGQNNFQSPNLYAFNEDQNIFLAAPLQTNIGLDPIPAGTVVASHYVFFDPGPSQRVIGTVDFDADILAIITATGTLQASDFLANTGVNYLNPGLRGLEAGDVVTITGPRQIRVDFTASNPGDYIRVITEFSPIAAGVPEPASLAVFGIGAIGLGFWRRTRRAAN